MWEVLSQAARLRVEKITRYVHRHIGGEFTRAQQQPGLGGAPAPNSTSAACVRNDRSNFSGPVAQDAEFGAGRIVFGQAG